MKNLHKVVIMFGLIVSFTSCKNDKKPNYQYMPNMYESVAYETYSESDAFDSPTGLKGKSGQLVVDGTIKRGYEPYEYANTTEGLEAAKANLKSPLDPATIDMDKAQGLYDIYCAICHGNAGDGKGKLVTNEKFLGVPSYKDREITEGGIFHVITYGLNSMGSHANQLNTEERWLVTAYVQKLKSEL
jgi:mono/diheme cytochrome c family protein